MGKLRVKVRLDHDAADSAYTEETEDSDGRRVKRTPPKVSTFGHEELGSGSEDGSDPHVEVPR